MEAGLGNDDWAWHMATGFAYMTDDAIGNRKQPISMALMVMAGGLCNNDGSIREKNTGRSTRGFKF